MPAGRTSGFSSGSRSSGGFSSSSRSSRGSYGSSNRSSNRSSSPSFTPSYSYLLYRRDDKKDKKNVIIPPPAPIIPTPPTFFDSIKQGFGFGVGSSVAHNIFDSKKEVVITNKTQPTNDVCDQIIKEYNECQKNYCSTEKLESIQKLYEQCKK